MSTSVGREHLGAHVIPVQPMALAVDMAREQAWEDNVLRQSRDDYLSQCWSLRILSDPVQIAEKRAEYEECYEARQHYVLMKRAGELDALHGRWIAMGKNGLLADAADLIQLATQLKPLRQDGTYKGLYTRRVGAPHSYYVNTM